MFSPSVTNQLPPNPTFPLQNVGIRGDIIENNNSNVSYHASERKEREKKKEKIESLFDQDRIGEVLNILA